MSHPYDEKMLEVCRELVTARTEARIALAKVARFYSQLMDLAEADLGPNAAEDQANEDCNILSRKHR